MSDEIKKIQDQINKIEGLMSPDLLNITNENQIVTTHRKKKKQKEKDDHTTKEENNETP